ncbi:hypothetical protein Cyast_2716 [Cyanobacterium stanieri PCC 7202]|uniref:O-GlcNAc transferase C-terminal domain-containing protein n=1 Tax=Cyanobacterium stanieri (strain ATCC 29140 / PCC 7202) TaxID=292563 RepID=K9YP44_CYASC|nr:hypothetical protein Cyast_2716 [Cyanobacterium stanieri PCC 7202]
MNSWHFSVIDYLKQENYQEVINIYENIIENNPEEIDNYWFLGLAYLLNKEPDQAQAIWFIPLANGDEDEIEKWTTELIVILQIELITQEHKKNYELLWLISRSIQELDPHNIENILSVLKLSTIINTFDNRLISESGIIDFLQNEKTKQVDLNYLLSVLESILNIPTKESILFAESCLIYTNCNPVFLEKIKLVAHAMGIDKNRLNYAIDLLKCVLNYSPEDVETYVRISYFYSIKNQLLKAIEIAEIPVVTRVGEQFAARNSYTYMMNAGITEGIAWSEEEYIEWGIKFGTDENLRKEVSWKLRQSKKNSPLWDAKQFTKDMEKAYQQMWEIYVNSKA